MKIEDAKEKLEYLKDVYITSAIGTDEHKDYYSNLAIACDLGAEALENQLNPDYVKVVRCKDCKYHEDCICVVCEDGDTVVCGKDHKHVTKNHYCSSSTR